MLLGKTSIQLERDAMNAVEKAIESLPAGAKMVAILTETIVRHRKTDCPYTRIVRKCWRNGTINAIYENAVNRQREREGNAEEFVAESLWKGKGQFVKGSKRIVEHIETGERYLAFMPKSVDNSPVVNYDLWEADNKEVTKEDIEPYLPKSGGAEKQETDKVIFWRVIKLDSIKALKYAGETITFA